ncbi:alpha/beta hydrolase fold [Nakamurella panacisegetis]|uniref:Alpha/beta hydrolase fold n=1 Tax=Nakamurella panacisegetis TaxID=1090615 RepID=A0A1H0QZN1_9ACTN|nr:alpha/beta hydrolase [Nakamurella panacisegetis]SDP22763.1 alpha/beta hydrolase fold [Nakamurella panacisegetis]
MRPYRRSVRPRSVVHGAAVVALLMLLAACATNIAGSATIGKASAVSGSTSGSVPTGPITQPSSTPGTSSSTSPSATSTGSAGVVPAGLEKFYGQQLDWGSCASYATSSGDASIYAQPALQCARLTVPMAYDNPTGATIKIGVLRKVATDRSARIGSVIMNPGGPGASGMSFVSQVAVYGLDAQLNARFDLVGFDPRGVGSSVPLIVCQTDAELDATRAQTARSNTPAAVSAAMAQLKGYAAGCVTKTAAAGNVDGKTFLANVGTRDVARDMDVLRGVLGDPKLTYVGFSYGTRIGYVYAEEFPKNVRAMILDGAVDPTRSVSESLVEQAKGFQQAFVTFATACAKLADCALGSDPSKATAAFQAMSRPLLANPLKLPQGRVLSYGDATLGVAEAMYDNSSWPDLEKALTDLKAGQGEKLMALADEYYQRDSSGKYSEKPDSFNAIRCVDDPAVTDPAEVIKVNQQVADAAPFEDSADPAADIPDLCAYWPVPATLKPGALSVPGLPKVLVISTTGDPATPYQNGVDLAQQLGADLLTYQGTRHAAFIVANSTCVNSAGNAYLLNLTLPAAGTTCS